MIAFLSKYSRLIAVVIFALIVWGVAEKLNTQAAHISKLNQEVRKQAEYIDKTLDLIDALAVRQKKNTEALERLNAENAAILANAKGKHQTIKESAKNDQTLNDWLNTNLPDGIGGLFLNQGQAARSGGH